MVNSGKLPGPPPVYEFGPQVRKGGANVDVSK
jgi:hypothetical protein